MKALFTYCCLLFGVLLQAQVNFSTQSFADALQKARTEGKLVFLQFEAAACSQCNDVANKGFAGKELAATMDQHFVSLKIGPNHPDRDKVAALYHLAAGNSFGTLFLDDNSTLLHSYLRTTSFSKEYLNQIDLALTKAGEVLKITELEKEYRNGNRGYDFVALLLQKRNALHLPTDSLLDEYAGLLPADSLRSVTALAFIAQMAPMLDSKAFRAIRTDNNLFNKAWYSLAQPARVGINNAIIYKSLEKAIREKNEQLATRTAMFAQGTNANPVSGAKAFDMNMLRYYEQVNDTANFFRTSIAYYQRYFLSVSPDSIKQADSLNQRRLLATAPKDTVREGNRVRIMAKVTYSPTVQRFSGELNNGAYKFYRYTNNPYLLSIATEWVKKALAFYETPEALDTYAKLLYKLNQKQAAIEMLAKAIALQQQRGYPTKRYEEDLLKMNRNEKLTD